MVEQLLKAIADAGRSDLEYDLRQKYCGQGNASVQNTKIS